MAWGVEDEGFLVVVNEFCEQLFGGSENPKANHRLDGAKTLETNGINYQPQLVFSPDFSHQQHVSPFEDHL